MGPKKYYGAELNGKTLAAHIEEADERQHYYSLLCKSLTNRIETADPLTDEFETIYTRLREAEQKVCEYSFAAQQLRFAADGLLPWEALKN